MHIKISKPLIKKWAITENIRLQTLNRRMENKIHQKPQVHEVYQKMIKIISTSHKNGLNSVPKLKFQ